MLLARRLLLWTWSGYALLWLMIAAIPYVQRGSREPDLGEAMIVVLGFAVAQVVILVALVTGIFLAWRALRQPAHRTWQNLALVGVSIVGAFGLAFYAGHFVGVL